MSKFSLIFALAKEFLKSGTHTHETLSRTSEEHRIALKFSGQYERLRVTDVYKE